MAESAEGGLLGLRVIGAFKLAKAVLLVVVGVGLARVLGRWTAADFEHLVLQLQLDPENRHIREAIARLTGIDRRSILAIQAGAFFYALLYLAEGVGLLLRKRWAGYLTIASTAALLPVEFYGFLRRPTPIRAAVIAVNLAIVAYLVVVLRRERAGRRSR